MMTDLAIEVNPERAHFRKELFTSWRSTPAVDICESEQDLVILIDLPGVDPSKLEIEVTGNILSVLGKASRDEGEGKAIFREYETHDYFRAFIVTEKLDTHGLVASLVDGVLKIVLPKIDKALSRRIPISAA
jgi:HSP20 family molecular chaperone IbpA